LQTGGKIGKAKGNAYNVAGDVKTTPEKRANSPSLRTEEAVLLAAFFAHLSEVHNLLGR
jgi:hypothetical protein